LKSLSQKFSVFIEPKLHYGLYKTQPVNLNQTGEISAQHDNSVSLTSTLILFSYLRLCFPNYLLPCKNVKLSMCLTKHHTSMTYGGVETELHVYLSSVLDECEWAASCPQALYSRRKWLPPVYISQKDGWAPEPFCKLWQQGK